MRHPVLLLMARAHVRLTFELDSSIGIAEGAWRTAQLNHAIFEQGIVKAKAQSPDFAHALAELEGMDGEICIDWSGRWQRVKDFFASPAGQMLISILKALLLLLPFIMEPAPTTESWTGQGPFDKSYLFDCLAFDSAPEAAPAGTVHTIRYAFVLRHIKAAVIAFQSGNVIGDGGAFDILAELADYLQPPETFAPSPSEVTMNDLASLIIGVEQLGSDFAAGNLVQAWKDSLPLQEAVIAILSPAAALKACPCDAATAARGDAACKALDSHCHAAANKAGALPWDGSLLKNLAAFILAVLPTLWNLFRPTPTPAPVP